MSSYMIPWSSKFKRCGLEVAEWVKVLTTQAWWPELESRNPHETDSTELSSNLHTHVVAHALYPISLTCIINRKKNLKILIYNRFKD